MRQCVEAAPAMAEELPCNSGGVAHGCAPNSATRYPGSTLFALPVFSPSAKCQSRSRKDLFEIVQAPVSA